MAGPASWYDSQAAETKNMARKALVEGSMKVFERDLTELLHRHGIEDIADMPDSVMAEMLCLMIKAVQPCVKKTLKWHGCGESVPVDKEGGQ